MIYHTPGTEYCPSDYKQLLALFDNKMSIDLYLFKGPESVVLLKKALDEGHLQEASTSGGARKLLYMTKMGREYWQSTK